MKRIFALLVAALLLPLGILTGCSQEDEVLPKQRENIVGFLKSTHNPKLISEADKAGSIDVNPPYYSVFGSTIYRYIANIYEEGRDSRAEVRRGSTATITYRAYVFESKTITDTTIPFDTNDPALKEFLFEQLTPGAWVFEPLVVKLGSTEIIKGLELALEGCREGDVVEAYMTYSMAYGDKNFSVIPRQSPVVYLFTVDKVE